MALPDCMWAKGFSTSNGKAAVELSLGDVNLTVGGAHKTLHNLEVTFWLLGFGATEHLQDVRNYTQASVGLYQAATTLASAGKQTMGAFSVSGTVTTSANASTGSVDAVLALEEGSSVISSRQATFVGSWKGGSQAPSYASL